MKKLLLVKVLLMTALTFWMGEAVGYEATARPPVAGVSLQKVYRTLLKTEESGKVKVSIAYVSPLLFKILKAGQNKSLVQQFEAIRRYQKEGGKYVFTVSLNTHVVKLSSYQMEKISFLRDDQGREYPAIGWEEGQSGMPSHHRTGVLVFPKVDARGNPIISDKAGFMEIVIKGLAGVQERTFRWDLPLD